MTSALGSLCALLYLASAWALGRRLKHGEGGAVPSAITALAAVAIIAHAGVLYQTVFTELGLNLGLFNAASLIGWVIAMLTLATAHSRSVDSLGLFVLPLAAFAVILAQVFPAESPVGAALGIGVQVHIAVSVIGYSALALAAIQAVLVWIQDRALRAKSHG